MQTTYRESSMCQVERKINGGHLGMVDSSTDEFPVIENDDTLKVHFSLSNLSFSWDGDKYESLLDLAEHLNIEISAGCRYGDCGTCSTQLLEGSVTYNHITGIDPDAGYCLPCSCRPLTSIMLKA